MSARTALLSVAAVAGLVALGGWWVANRPPQRDSAAEAVYVCTGGQKTASDFGLQTGITDTSVKVAAVMNTKFGEITKYAADPESTKQQFQYLACIDRRMAEALAAKVQQPSDCTELDPCVDLVRVADFTQSRCAAPGVERRDLVILEDSVTVTPATVNKYTASAQPSGKATLEVTRLDDGGQTIVVPATFPACTDCSRPSYPIAHFNIPLTNGKGQYTWNWTDGHSDNRDGLVVKTLYRLRNFHAQVVLPPDVTLSSVPVVPPTAAAKCVVGYNNIVCRDLTAPENRELLQWYWNWNMWSRCSKAATTAESTASATSATVAASAPEAASAKTAGVTSQPATGPAASTASVPR